MTDNTDEQLSALIDGEFEDETQIDRLLNEPLARVAWRSYYLSRDVIQGDYTAALGADFAARVSAEIAAEPTLSNLHSIGSASQRQSRSAAAAKTPLYRQASDEHAQSQYSPSTLHWKPVAGLAVAASLVGVTLFSMGWFNQPNIQPSTPALTLASLDPQLVSGSDGTRWMSEGVASQGADALVAERLNSLLTDHLEGANMGRVQGMLVHARVAGYDLGYTAGSNDSL